MYMSLGTSQSPANALSPPVSCLYRSSRCFHCIYFPYFCRTKQLETSIIRYEMNITMRTNSILFWILPANSDHLHQMERIGDKVQEAFVVRSKDITNLVY